MNKYYVRRTDDTTGHWTVSDAETFDKTTGYIDESGGVIDCCAAFETKLEAEQALARFHAICTQPERTFETKLKADVGHPNTDDEAGELEIRTFTSGATRDTAEGKLDYVKALSPIVLRRYVEYLNKHRLQPDGSYRDFDNWKKGIPQDTYMSSLGRHFLDEWLLSEGYDAEDNHGPVEEEDILCAILFNAMGKLHEMLKGKPGA